MNSDQTLRSKFQKFELQRSSMRLKTLKTSCQGIVHFDKIVKIYVHCLMCVFFFNLLERI